VQQRLGMAEALLGRYDVARERLHGVEAALREAPCCLPPVFVVERLCACFMMCAAPPAAIERGLLPRRALSAPAPAVAPCLAATRCMQVVENTRPARRLAAPPLCPALSPGTGTRQTCSELLGPCRGCAGREQPGA
jgi:hypothetical protein